MDTITIYGKLAGVECNATFRQMDRTEIDQTDATSPKISVS
jgi:hypothetical protein